MPLFMDVHTIDGGVFADEVAKAYMACLQAQGRRDVSSLRCGVNEADGKVFCLVETPDATEAAAVHREAHGLVADEIHFVHEGA